MDGDLGSDFQVAGDLGVAGAGDLPFLGVFLDDDFRVGELKNRTGDLIGGDPGVKRSRETEEDG